MLAVVPLPDLGARAVAFYIAQGRVQPVAAGSALLCGKDLDLLPVGEGGVERRHHAVHLGSAAAMAQLGMHVVSEIYRRCPFRQIDHLALRREQVDRVLEETVPELFGEVTGVAGIADLVLPLEDLAQPRNLFVVPAFPARAFLVAPMRRHPQLGILVHLVGADLHFERLAVRADYRRVEGPVPVALGPGDVIVELLGDRQPEVVDQPQHGIAVGNVTDQDPNGPCVINRRKIIAFSHHLLVDTEDVFRPSRDLRRDSGAGNVALEQRDGVIEIALAVHPFLVEQPGDALVGFWLEYPEREILHLPLELPDAQAVCQRRENIAGKASALAPRLAVPQPDDVAQFLRVIGQLDQHDADVLHHREEHLAQRLELARTLVRFQPGLRKIGKRSDLRHAQHTLGEVGHGLAQGLPQPGRAFGRKVVGLKSQCGGQRFVVQAQLADQFGGRERVREQPLAGRELAFAVERRNKTQSGAERFPVRGRVLPADAIQPFSGIALERRFDQPEVRGRGFHAGSFRY